MHGRRDMWDAISHRTEAADAEDARGLLGGAELGAAGGGSDDGAIGGLAGVDVDVLGRVGVLARGK